MKFKMTSTKDRYIINEKFDNILLFNYILSIYNYINKNFNYIYKLYYLIFIYHSIYKNFIYLIDF